MTAWKGWVEKLGQYRKDCGWKRNESDELVQHRFYLGSVADEAKYRAASLERLWGLVKQFHAIDVANCAAWAWDERPTWDEDSTLEIAKAIAKGGTSVALQPHTENETAEQYVQWLGLLAQLYLFTALTP